MSSQHLILTSHLKMLSLLFTPFSVTHFAMHRIYADCINSRGMPRVFCDLRSQKTPRGILPVNSNFHSTKNGKCFRTRSSKNVHTDKRSYKIYQPYHTPEKKSRKTHPKIPPQFDTLPADSKAPRHTPSRQRSASIHSQPTAKCLGPPPSHQTTRKLSLSSTPSSAALTAHPTPAQPP